MAKEEQNYEEDMYYTDFNIKIRDLEEKQDLLKDRILLIGENFISEKQEINQEIFELKQEINTIKQDINKLNLTMQRIIESHEDFARKKEIGILEKQFKMFQPLKLATLKDVEKMIKESKKA